MNADRDPMRSTLNDEFGSARLQMRFDPPGSISERLGGIENQIQRSVAGDAGANSRNPAGCRRGGVKLFQADRKRQLNEQS